ncbi:hypothetical protein D3C72_2302660 [compost metagenome]
MAQRNGSTQRVDLGGVQLELADDGQGLGSEGFVELDPVQRVLGDAGAVQHLGNGGDGTDAHDLGRHAGDGEANKTGERAQVELAQDAIGHQDHGGGAV